MVNIKLNKFSRSNVDPIPEQVETVSPETPYQGENEINQEDEDMDDSFEDAFKDLTNDNYVSEETEIKQTKAEKERLKLEKEQLKYEILKQKEEDRRNQANQKLFEKTTRSRKVQQEDDELFSSCPSEIMGLDKRQLLKKISEYKSLFPQLLKSFKIKKNPSIEDLRDVLAEFDAIVSVSSVEGFVTDALLSCITLIETGSTRTKFNISGTAEMLRAQPKFHDLCKQMYLKHHVFSNVPCEYQLIMLVGMTAMVAHQQNQKREKVSNLLNKPMP